MGILADPGNVVLPYTLLRIGSPYEYLGVRKKDVGRLSDLLEMH